MTHDSKNIADGCMGVKDVDNKIRLSTAGESSNASTVSPTSSASSSYGSTGSTTQGTKKGIN